eukprot:1142732-Pelagomonas_calceolata.AAC.2
MCLQQKQGERQIPNLKQKIEKMKLGSPKPENCTIHLFTVKAQWHLLYFTNGGILMQSSTARGPYKVPEELMQPRAQN